jgi:hypothetical protein
MYRYKEWTSGYCVIVDGLCDEDDDNRIMMKCDSLAAYEVHRMQKIAKLIGASGI